MMHKFRRRVFGVSLFEVILLMFAISLLVVAGIKYKKHQTEVAAAQLYGQNLYVFGQAVHNYVINSPNLYAMGGLPDPTGTGYNPLVLRQISPNLIILTATGVLWLQQANAGVNGISQQPFLATGFSFNNALAPLMLATPDAQGVATAKTGDSTLKTVISFNPTTPNVPPTITITTGVLYEQPTKSAGTPTLKSDLTEAAIQAANTMYSPTMGTPNFTFTVPYINAGAYNPGAVPTGTINVSTAGDIYLRVDGSDSMVGPLNFAAAVPINNQINNLEVLSFDGTNASNILTLGFLSFTGSTTSNISGLDRLSFVSAGNSSQITGLHSLNFNGAAAATGANAAMISGLNTLNFQTYQTGSGPISIGTINGLSYSSFQGMRVSGPYTSTGWAGKLTDTTVAIYDKNGLPRSACFLNEVVENYLNASYLNPSVGLGMGPWGCRVLPSFGVNPNWLIMNELGNSSTCSAYCVEWN
jgi:hypothetical protein